MYKCEKDHNLVLNEGILDSSLKIIESVPSPWPLLRIKVHEQPCIWSVISYRESDASNLPPLTNKSDMTRSDDVY